MFHSVDCSMTSPEGITARRERTLRHISQTAIQLFHKHGLGNVTMTMVASSAQISRKTLYEYAPTKRALVGVVLDQVSEYLAESIGSIVLQKNRPVLDRFRSVFEVVAKGLQQSHRALQDIAAEYPDEWEQFERIRGERAADNFRILADEGLSTGVLRQDIPVAVLVDVYLAFVRGVLTDPRSADNSDLLFSQGVTLLLEGMVIRNR